ncbi:hypothetical protein C8R11_11314 [Nitrosomonas aestuarii]|nr:hypothetical protein C8R11_11314 [Nitrosomonas aestuarii]
MPEINTKLLKSVVFLLLGFQLPTAPPIASTGHEYRANAGFIYNFLAIKS